MILPNDIFARVVLFLLGAAGFYVARKVYLHKKVQQPLVCMVGFDCHTVVHSDYSRFFGVPVEILGMFYYGAVSVFYLALLFVFDTLPVLLVDFMVLLSCGAFFFSAYLIGVQIFILRKGCSWCIVSALISTVIFIVTIKSYNLSEIFQPLLFW